MYKLSNLLFILLLLFLFSPFSMGQTPPNLSRSSDRLWLDSEIGHQGDCQWKMIKAGDVTDPGRENLVIKLCNCKLDAGYRTRNSVEFFGV